VQQAASQALRYMESQDKAKLYYFLVQAHYYLAKGVSSNKPEAINNYFSAIKVSIVGYKISKLNKSLYLNAIQACHKELQPFLCQSIDKENINSNQLARRPLETFHNIGHSLNVLVKKIESANSMFVDYTDDLNLCSKYIKHYQSEVKANSASFWGSPKVTGQATHTVEPTPTCILK